MSDEQERIENQVDENHEQDDGEPSVEDVRALAELLRLTRELRRRVLRLGDKYGACDYAGHVEYDETPFGRALRGMECQLGEAIIPANAYLAGQLLVDSQLKCVCGSSDWNQWSAVAEGGDEPACAECQCCGLRMMFRVLPKRPQQARSCTCEPPSCTCALCGDEDISF